MLRQRRNETQAICGGCDLSKLAQLWMEDATACILYYFVISLRVAFTSWEFLCQLLCM